MGKTPRLAVVAEGVETMEQAGFLPDHACDEMQGYHFSKPIAADEFANFLRSHAAIAEAWRLIAACSGKH
jgi:EAL domain-containing protein (putative c-di-GMP-specific phosphodiesterase class I)